MTAPNTFTPASLADAYRHERLIGLPLRWVIVALGAAVILTADSAPFGGGLSAPWVLYALFALISTLLVWLVEIPPLSWLLWLAFAGDLAFSSYLIVADGGVASDLYLLYGLLALKAILLLPTFPQRNARSPLLLFSPLILPFVLGPLYILLLWNTHGDLGFLRERGFLLRYLLLWAWILAACLAAWFVARWQRAAHDLSRAFTQQESDLAQKTAILQRTASDLGQRVLELRTLQEVMQALASTLRMEEVSRVIVARLANLLGVSHCAVAVLDQEGLRLLGSIAAGQAPPSPATPHPHAPMPPYPPKIGGQGGGAPGAATDPGALHAFSVELAGEPAAATALSSEQPVIVSDAAASASPDQRALFQRWGMRSYLVIPLIARQRPVGALYLGDSRAGLPFGEAEQQLGLSFAYFAATAVENARLYQEAWDKSSELEAVVVGIGDAVLVTDPQARLLLMNPVAMRIFGAAQMLTGAPLAELAPQSPLLPLIAEASTAAQLPVVRELDLMTAHDRRLHTYQALASPMSSVEGAQRGVVTVLRDITARVELERMKTNFLSVVSHELRTPLHSIKGFVEIILMGKTGPINELQRDFLGVVKEQTQQLQRLISDLLEFNRMEAGQIKLRIETLDLGQLVAAVVAKMAPQAANGKVAIANHLSPDFPVIEADPLRIEQVLTNLVDNAIKFTPAGGVVTINGRAETPANQDDDIELCVSDTGIGIPPTEQQRIFDRFYQVDGSSSRLYKGAGLGLSICKHIVEYHGGRIWVASPLDEGRGAAFHIRLPRRRAGPEAPLDFTNLPPTASEEASHVA